jgi:hypothetical protein
VAYQTKPSTPNLSTPQMRSATSRSSTSLGSRLHYCNTHLFT